MQEAAFAADGDATLRTTVVDRARGLRWPGGYTIRVLASAFTDRWHGDEAGLEAALAQEGPRWRAAAAAGDPSLANAVVGEAAGLMTARAPAADLLARMMAEAQDALARGAAHARLKG
jgi:nitronate monooxygenase